MSARGDLPTSARPAEIGRLARGLGMAAGLLFLGGAAGILAIPGSVAPPARVGIVASFHIDRGQSSPLATPQAAPGEIVATQPPATVAPPVTAPAPRPAAQPSRQPSRITGTAAPSRVAANANRSSEAGYGCQAAIAWLTEHAAPGFSFMCPGYALGHQAMTCQNVASVCPGNVRLIVIADPCPAAYKNEAWNSWVVEGLIAGPIDPFGWCH